MERGSSSISHDPAAPRLWTQRDAAVLLALLPASLLFVASLWTRAGWFDSHESIHQLTRLFEMTEALRGGQFPVRWSDNLMGGHGLPFFNFYAPFAFYLAGLFHLAGFSLESAWKMEFVVAAWAGAAGMYGLVRGRAGRAAGGVAAMLFLFAPYHALTLYVRGNAAEFTALCVWPLAFWGVDAALRGGRWRRPALPAAALAIGALAFSHTVTAYIAAWNLVAWGAFVWWRESRPAWRVRAPRLAAILAFTGLAGAAIAAFYALPAVHDLRYCSTHVLYERTRFFDHYPTPIQLLLPHWGFGPSLPGPVDEMDFHLGIALWLGVAAAAVVLVLRRRSELAPWIAAGLAGTFVHVFLMLDVSRPVWGLLPGSAYLQFPWRLLIPAVFWACVASGWALGAMLQGRAWTASRTALAISCAVLPVLLGVWFCKPARWIPEPPVYVADRLRLAIIDTAEGEYLPRWVADRPTVPSRRHLLGPGGEVLGEMIAFDSARYEFEVRVPGNTTATFEHFHYPGWTAEADGQPVAITPHDGTGFMEFPLAAGTAHVLVEFRGTALHRGTNVLSGLAVLGTLGWLLTAAIVALWRRAHLRGE
ncbi:MAG: hypothetical protein PWP23_320 [Candidatus Sumerlaeota bacterium]|nr:hypothetical protein [Candidatus Sumerlaeota bacterium]